MEKEVGNVKQFVLMWTSSYEIVKNVFEKLWLAFKEKANVNKISFEAIIA